MAPFARIDRRSGRAVGCTVFWEPRFWPDRPELCAIEIGWTWLARFEGVLRRWSPSHAAGEEGRLRDSAMYSVIEGEWPDVREGLLRRMGRG